MQDNLAKLAKQRKTSIGEDRLALAFADEHVDHLRYVAPWGRWLMWDGARWAHDDTLHAADRVRIVCRDLDGKAPARLVAAVERLAKADRRLAASVDQWDADAWVLNTPGGVVDLRTGKMRAHNGDDYMTKVTAVSPDDECPTPNWNAFLELVTGNDAELIGLLQRVSGYALTGSTEEHALFFLHGEGDNGKSTFISTLTGIVGDFHKTAAIETFTAVSLGEQHPTNLADLRGARLVTAIEVEEGRRWAEAKIKALTGGDEIAARFMRCDFFTYTPVFKLMIAANHKPVIRSVDVAMKRRLHLIPFEKQVPAKQRVKDFAARRLRREWPGILAWMIKGCLEWQRQGLAPPAAVTEATSAYMADEDAIGTWLAEATEPHLTEWEGSTRLFGAWRQWAEAAGEYVGTQRRFVQKLAAHGLVAERREHARGFRGIRLVDYSPPLTTSNKRFTS